jgi:Dolichyl-phosphate-mannose-protein mannosyltransferase
MRVLNLTARSGRIELAEAIAGVCERHRIWLLCGFSVLYLAVVGVIAARKHLANDELYTLNIARLPGLDEVWSALLTGAEQLPPFFYVLMRGSLAPLGESNLSLRLPAIIGVWVMGLCLFRFVSRRSTALYGLVAMLFPLTTGAYYYAFEARPYALVLGFSGLALVCWQSLTEGEGRALSLVGLALSLAAAISCHYYAILVLIPFICGETARMLSRRRCDIPVWVAMAASLTPLLIFLPLITRARSYSKAFWSQPGWGDIPGFFYFILMSTALPMTAILILSVLYTALFPTNIRPANDQSRFGLRGYEIVAAVGFLAIPFVAVALAMFVTGAFANRYALPAVLGLGILMPFAFHQLLGSREALTLLLILALAFGFVRRAGMTLEESAKQAKNLEGAVGMLQNEDTRNLPIVCSDPHIFLLLSQYGPPEIRSRLVYTADPEASMRYLGHDSIEQGMIDLLKPWFRLNVQEYRIFIATSTASGRSFLLCGEPGYFLNWVFQDLVSSDAQLELIDRHKEFLLFLVNTRKGPEPPGLNGGTHKVRSVGEVNRK